MQKQMGQMSLSDALITSRNNFLADVDGLVDWTRIENELVGIYGSSTGRPSYPLLMLFKILLLQQWHRLSDTEIEEALADRISFRRFAGLSLSDSVPDHSTLSRFRTRLGDRYTRLLSALNAQFESRGMVIKEGTMLDASFVRSVSNKKSVDPESGQHVADSACGYKMHARVDRGSGIVCRVIVTPANINDTTIADDLIMGDEKAVYADKAYDNDAKREALEKRGVFAGIMHRPEP